MIEFTQKLALECTVCGNQMMHLETYGPPSQTGTIQVVPCRVCATAPRQVRLREGVQDKTSDGHTVLVDEHNVMISVTNQEPLVEIMWLDEAGNARESKGQACHPKDLLDAIELAGWTREKLEELKS